MLKKALLGLFALACCTTSLHSTPSITHLEYADGTWKGLDPDKMKDEELVSRFILADDAKVNSLINISLRESWWSRPQEYAWVAQFAGPDLVVLDAACGISHPFKWFLGKSCKTTYACDLDTRLDSKERIIQETFDDLGEEAYNVIANDPLIWDEVQLHIASIYDLPETFPKFDRIFCVSTLEDLSEENRELTLKNFAHFLNEDGLIIITCDYPAVSIEHLWKAVDKAGLMPAGKVEKTFPAKGILADPWNVLAVYRCALKHKPKTDRAD